MSHINCLKIPTSQFRKNIFLSVYIYLVCHILRFSKLVFLKGPIIRGDTLISLGNDNYLDSTSKLVRNIS